MLSSIRFPCFPNIATHDLLTNVSENPWQNHQTLLYLTESDNYDGNELGV